VPSGLASRRTNSVTPNRPSNTRVAAIW
jgi:hypothetical protein